MKGSLHFRLFQCWKQLNIQEAPFAKLFGWEGVTTYERDVFVQIRNSVVRSKALVLVNFLSTFVHDHDLLVTYIMDDAVN